MIYWGKFLVLFCFLVAVPELAKAGGTKREASPSQNPSTPTAPKEPPSGSFPTTPSTPNQYETVKEIIVPATQAIAGTKVQISVSDIFQIQVIAKLEEPAKVNESQYPFLKPTAENGYRNVADVGQVSLWVDGALVGSARVASYLLYPYLFNYNLSAGEHHIKVVLSDGRNNTVLSKVRVITARPPLALHARTMKKSSDGSDYDSPIWGYGFHNVGPYGKVGSASESFSAPSGDYEVEVIAFGGGCDAIAEIDNPEAQPSMTVKIDGNALTSVEYGTPTVIVKKFCPGVYHYDVKGLGQGAHTISVSSEGSAQKALYVGSIVIQPKTKIKPIDEQFFGRHVYGSDLPNFSLNGKTGTTRLWGSSMWGYYEAPPEKDEHGKITKHNYYWDDLHQKVSLSSQAELILTFGWVPTWLNPDKNKGNPNNPSDQWGTYVDPKTQMDIWSNYVTQLVKESTKTGMIRNWELWNEADSTDKNVDVFWYGSAEELEQITSKAVQILKANDPNADDPNKRFRIISPSVTNGNFVGDWLRAYFASGANEYTDVAAYHGYAGSGGEDVIARIAEVRAAQVEMGLGGKPMWNTETSWGTDDVYQTKDDPAGTHPDVRFVQAAFVAPHYLLQAAHGVERVVWYSLANWGSFTDDKGDETLAGKAFKSVQTLLLGATDVSCKIIKEPVWSCVIQKPSAPNSTVYWIDTRTIYRHTVKNGRQLFNEKTLPLESISIESDAELVYRTITQDQSQSQKVADKKITLGLMPIIVEAPAANTVASSMINPSQIIGAIQEGIKWAKEIASRVFGGSASDGSSSDSAPIVAAEGGSSTFALDKTPAQIGVSTPELASLNIIPQSDAVYLASSVIPSPSPTTSPQALSVVKEEIAAVQAPVEARVIASEEQPSVSDVYESSAPLEQRMKCEDRFNALFEASKRWHQTMHQISCDTLKQEMASVRDSSSICEGLKLKDLSSRFQQKLFGIDDLHASVNDGVRELFSKVMNHDNQDLLDDCSQVNQAVPADPVFQNPVDPIDESFRERKVQRALEAN